MSPYTLPSPGVRWRAYNIPLKSNEMEFWALFYGSKSIFEIEESGDCLVPDVENPGSQKNTQKINVAVVDVVVSDIDGLAVGRMGVYC